MSPGTVVVPHKRPRFLALLAGCAWLVTACTPTIEPGKFACDETRGCPSDWFCHSNGRCYPGPETGDGGVDGGGPCGGSCDDDNACTEDLCDLIRNECVHRDLDNGSECGGDDLCCGGVCVDTATDSLACGSGCALCGANEGCAGGVCGCVNPWADCDFGVPGCEANLHSDPNNCGGCGQTCNTGESCILKSGNPTCTACSAAGDCDDGLDCTTDSCAVSSGQCTASVDPGSCLIDGVCYVDGARNPTNPCLVCDPPAKATDWSPNDGAACGGGSACTTGNVCRDGACVAGEPLCDDGELCNGIEGCTKGLCSPGMPPCAGTATTPGNNCVSDGRLSCAAVACGERNKPCCENYGNGRPECDSGTLFPLICRIVLGGGGRTCQ